MFQRLVDDGFDIAIRNHAGAILSVDFPDQIAGLESALLEPAIPVGELIGSGGGEAKSTQRLRNRLYAEGWRKHNFNFRLIVDGVETVSHSHEIDHVCRSAAGVIALEIEWNNKDPFFDRDLENFQRLHAQSAISLGVIITRGASLQGNMVALVRDCIEQRGITDEAGMIAAFSMKDRTQRQREAVAGRMARGESFAQGFAQAFVADKFGQATTHWAKLKERIDRGVGNPCPLLLIGLPVGVVTR
ncbi:MAG: restriction endonuclease [Rubellimicrobium sp.]|nr:restriction endonuclease [Rubellimicrobium sp.]